MPGAAATRLPDARFLARGASKGALLARRAKIS